MKQIFFLLLATFLLASCNKPVANFTYSANKRVAPAKVQFDNQSKKAVSYHWDFGDGHTSEEASPSHTYYSSGNHTVQLKAMNGEKSGTAKKNLFVEQPLDCLVLIETAFGNMTLALSNATPQHRDNFVKLAEEGYFDNLLFHRVIEGFMVQGGDPNSRNASAGQSLGMGGPNYTVPAEFVDSLIHAKGVIAAARTGGASNPEKRSSGSQFYIVQGKVLTNAELDAIETQKGIRYTPEQRAIYTTLGGTPFLDREYTVFGRVIDGLDVIDKIAAVPTGTNDRPEQDVKMKIKVVGR